MNRGEWVSLHRSLRSRRVAHDTKGLTLARDSIGVLGVTKRHDNGHAIAQAAIAGILHIASFHRAMPEHHAIYMAKVRALRKFGTWFGKL